ncbi:hypothetical protein EG329_002179 [Mollisiaceae sp. DMI_Dod_QoI]|nr:hypothetical protein EG329_002179 [Helotiales sp. DMI_Dod_QoI]
MQSREYPTKKATFPRSEQEMGKPYLPAEEESSRMTSNNLAKLNPPLSGSRPVARGAQNLSFQWSENTNSSTGQSSNVTTTDLGYMTSATSYHAESDDEKKVCTPAIQQVALRQDVPGMADEQDDRKLSNLLRPLSPPSTRGNNVKILEREIPEAKRLSFVPVLMETKAPSLPRFQEENCGRTDRAWPQESTLSRNSHTKSEQFQQQQASHARSVSALTASSDGSSSAFGATCPPKLRRKPDFQPDITKCRDISKT